MSDMNEKLLIGTGLAALAAKDIVTKILGPTADYVGGQIKGLVEKANINLGAVFGNAAKKLGSTINEDGAVSPRVLRHIWEEGQFCEDVIAVEYFGGLLASARSPDGRDDRAVNLIATTRALSVFDLRLHFLIYSLARKFFLRREIRISDAEGRVAMAIYIPFRVYTHALDLPDGPASQDLAAHSLLALVKHELVDHRFTMGPQEVMFRHCPGAKEPGLFVIPSFFGAELFLWAHGHSDKRIDQFLDPTVVCESEVNMEIIEGSLPARDTVSPT